MSRTTKHIQWSELTRLVEAMKQDGNRLHLYARIQSLLGLRAKDVLSLTWRDLLDNAELVISESKTGKTRRMIVNDSLRDAIEEAYATQFIKDRRELIFLNKHKTGAISLSFVNRSLKKAFKKHGVQAKQVSSHVFRKSFAYKILEEGDFSEKAIFLVMRLLNHANINTTMRYLLLDEKEADEAYMKLAI